jgi:hypothetical protein
VAFLSRLLEAGVDVRFADLPQIEGATGRFMLQQMVAVAELEAGMISDRTKKASAAAKRRGVKLGGNRGTMPTAKMQKASKAALEARADPRAADVGPAIKEIQAAGAASLRAIADGLNAKGIPPRLLDNAWHALVGVRHLGVLAFNPDGQILKAIHQQNLETAARERFGRFASFVIGAMNTQANAAEATREDALSRLRPVALPIPDLAKEAGDYLASLAPQASDQAWAASARTFRSDNGHLQLLSV